MLFFFLKTTLKVYLKQQQFRRQGFRRVLDHSPTVDQNSQLVIN